MGVLLRVSTQYGYVYGVTGPAWPAHPAWLAKFLEALGTRVEHGVAAVV